MPNPNPSLNERLAEKLGLAERMIPLCVEGHRTFHWRDCNGTLWEECPDLLSYAGMGVVLEGMVQRGYSYSLYGTTPLSSVLRYPTAAFVRGVHPPQMYGPNAKGAFIGEGDTLPLAVAEAALLALEGEADGRNHL